MDQLKGAFNSFTGSNNNNNNTNNPNENQSQVNPQSSSYSQQQEPSQTQTSSSSSGGFLGGLTDKFNTAAGGGRESEKNEDMLDKGVDYVQENFFGQGAQDNESAVEQAKDEQISDFIRGKYKTTTGSDFPIKDKETRFG